MVLKRLLSYYLQFPDAGKRLCSVMPSTLMRVPMDRTTDLLWHVAATGRGAAAKRPQVHDGRLSIVFCGVGGASEARAGLS